MKLQTSWLFHKWVIFSGISHLHNLKCFYSTVSKVLVCYSVNVNQGHSTKPCTVFQGGTIFKLWFVISFWDNITECWGYEKICNSKKFLNMQWWKINSNYVMNLKCFWQSIPEWQLMASSQPWFWAHSIHFSLFMLPHNTNRYCLKQPSSDLRPHILQIVVEQSGLIMENKYIKSICLCIVLH